MVKSIPFVWLSFTTVLTAAESKVLTIDGSTGVMPLVRELVVPFEKAQPDFKITMGKGWSSKTRLQALADGKMDIAMASHGLDEDTLKKLELTPHLFAKMAVVFAVHSSVPLKNLTIPQLAAIYRGDINNWSEVGGPDLPIKRLMRPEDEVDTEILRAQIPEFKKIQWAERTLIFQSSGDLARNLNKTIGGIGITTRVRADQGGQTSTIMIDGIEPTESNIMNGTYTLTRNSYLVTPNQPSEMVSAFLSFLKEKSARDAIRNSKAIPFSN
ncbi:MAG: substrate-binding domain-containing protein [Verrucomicrobiales bacterium]|nr:substrate-binding domain-containing protein [Verrucomicrobiales bacterium]